MGDVCGRYEGHLVHGGLLDAGGMRLVSLQLGKLHDVQGASRLQNVPVPCGVCWEGAACGTGGAGGAAAAAWYCLCLLLLLPGTACHLLVLLLDQAGPAGTRCREGGLGAERCDGPGCLEMWEFGGGSEGFRLLGELRGAEGDCVSVSGDICVGAVRLRMAERVTGERKALSQMNMLDCCLQDLAIWAPLS